VVSLCQAINLLQPSLLCRHNLNEDDLPLELVPVAPPLAPFGLLFNTVPMQLFLHSALGIELFAIHLGESEHHVGELADLLLNHVELFFT
jgi:hypothetical protein